MIPENSRQAFAWREPGRIIFNLSRNSSNPIITDSAFRYLYRKEAIKLGGLEAGKRTAIHRGETVITTKTLIAGIS
jgi:hypothetical protein